jgi:hypothetical protein
MYYADEDFVRPLRRAMPQPPVSVMGITVFKNITYGSWLVGSFSGLFEWHPKTGEIYDRITGKPYHPPAKAGRPVGDNIISGYLADYKGNEVYFDYNRGAIIPGGTELFIPMPGGTANTPMSLWNLALEIHTARIYKFMLGNFYILIIPLSGLFVLFILISGFWVWYRKHRKTNCRKYDGEILKSKL